MKEAWILMKTCVIGASVCFLALSSVAFCADKKPLPNQAGNDDVDLEGSVMIDRNEIQQALGADPGPGYVVVHLKVTPKTDKALSVSPEDFTLLERNSGERAVALAPNEIAGAAAPMVVKTDPENQNGNTGVGIGGIRLGRGPKKAEPSKADKSDSEPKPPSRGNGDTVLLAALKSKTLPEQETKTPIEGLLYFSLSGKLKVKDLSLLYKGPAGRLTFDFK